MNPVSTDLARKQRILAGFRGRSLLQAIADPALRQDMEEEARSTTLDRLVTPDLVAVANAASRARQVSPRLSLFAPVADVIVLPGLLASQLTDTSGGNGLIWINPTLIFNSNPLLALGLKPNNIDQDSTPGVSIQPDGAIPVVYAGLRAVLELNRFHVVEFGFDWRKNFDESAEQLADVIRDRANQPSRPLHLVAHSQGSLVARGALQLLGQDRGLQLVNSLILLGPATAGSFSAATGIAGDNQLLNTAQEVGITPPPGFTQVLQSMSGLYQLLPWRTDPVDGASPDPAIQWVQEHPEFHTPAFWAASGVDADRLNVLFGSAAGIDSSYLNGRTSIILGDQPTAGGVKWVPDTTMPGGMRLDNDDAFATTGDGTVPDSMALVAGVTQVFKAPGAEHSMLPATLSVITAVLDILQGIPPTLPSFPVGSAAAPVLPAALPHLSKPLSADGLFRFRPVVAPLPSG
jgi:hypothetical protein